MCKLVTFLVVMCLSSASLAAEPFVLVQYSGTAQPGAISINWSSLFQDPMVMAALVIGGLLFASKVLKLDLTKIFPVVLTLLNSLLKPATPAPPVTPVPPTVPVTPATPTVDLLQLLLQLLTDAKFSGDKAGEEAVLSVLKRIK